MAKEMALRSAEKDSLGKIYFLSLVAVDKFGITEKYKFIYDILSETYDFDGADVVFIDAQKLWDFFKKYHPNAKRSKHDILELAEFFIRKHPDSSFILDEVPSPKRRGKRGGMFKLML